MKFNICDEIVYLNTSTAKFVKDEVRRIQVIPTGISAGEDGKNRLDGYAVFYETGQGPVVAETEAFASEEEAKRFWRDVLAE